MEQFSKGDKVVCVEVSHDLYSNQGITIGNVYTVKEAYISDNRGVPWIYVEMDDDGGRMNYLASDFELHVEEEDNIDWTFEET